MAIIINQATDDKITYQFNVSRLNGNVITSAVITSDDVNISNVSNDTEAFYFTAGTDGLTGRYDIDVDLILSNGDRYNRCINVNVGKLTF